MNQSRFGESIELGNESFKQMEARPVLNFSMQTGEEFSLEFLRDRINSRTPSAANTAVNTSGSIDAKNIVGGPKEFERGNSSLTDGKSNYSLSHTASVSSSASGSSSAKMKILCSFGGQIIPRPSDRKLRYVGGETRMIRINKDISWQELKQKTMEIFRQNHIIRYQLPGEGLDTLVSVSCDDDLQIMVEEGEVEEGSKKLRMFLFSSSDLEDTDYSFASAGGDSDVNYVVAVNGMELGSRKQSLVHDLPITSENSLKELDGQRFKKIVDGEAADLTGVSTLRTDMIACSSTIQSSQTVQPIPSSIEGIHPHLSKGPKMLHTEEAVSSHLEESSGHILLHEHTPQDGVTDGHQYDGLQGQQPDSADKERLKTEDPVPQESDPGKVFSLDNHPSTLSGPQEGSTVDHIAVEEALITISATEGKHVLPVPDVSLLEDYSSTQHHRPDSNDKFVSTDTSFLPSDADFESDLIDFSNNDQPALHQRVFYSEKIPRDQAEIWSRLSKSDHSLDSQLLISHPHSDNPWQDSISEPIDFSQNRVEAAETEDTFLSMKPLHTEPPSINEGLEQLQSYKMFADEISKTTPKHSRYISELNPEEYVLNSINDKGFMNDDRALKTDPETLKEDCLNKCALEVDEQVGGGSKQLPVKQDSPVKHQEDPASSLPELDWGKIGVIDHTSDSNLGLHQPSVVSGSSTIDVPRMETPDVLSMQEREDMLVDINERVPDDFLSDMFSKSVVLNDSSGFGQLNIDGVGLSVNMENHEPKRWSYFQKLAQDQSLRNEISLIDMDHHDYPYEFPKFKDEGLKSYDFTPLGTDGNVEAQIDSGKETPREFLHKVAADNTAAPLPNYDPSQVVSEREHENGKHQIRNIGLPPIDLSAGDVISSSLQVIKNGDLEELKELGSGTFGTVYHGKWRGTDVAIKRLKNSCFTGRSSEQETMSTEFWGEADIISKLHHPNVVAFYGVVQDGPGGTLATVVEFMVDGSLSHILLRKDCIWDGIFALKEHNSF